VLGRPLLAPRRLPWRARVGDYSGSSARRTRGRPRLEVLDSLIVLAMGLSAHLASDLWPAGNGALRLGIDGNDAARILLVLALTAPLSLAIAGAYRADPRGRGGGLALSGRLLVAGALSCWGAYWICEAAGWAPRMEGLAVFSVLLPMGWLARRGPWAGTARERVAVVGSGRVLDRLVDLVRRHPERRFEVLGHFDDDQPAVPGAVQWLGTLGALPSALASGGIDRVIVAFSRRTDEQTLEVLRLCDRHGVTVDVVPRLYELMGWEPRVHHLGGLTLLNVSASAPAKRHHLAKRAFDCAGALLILALLSPLVALVSAVVLVTSGAPVLYRQERVGLRGRRFQMFKFRSMSSAADPADAARIREHANGDLAIGDAVALIKAANATRVTRVGRVLRETSLDELPQLFNVLLGQMSLVGPRPLRPFEADVLDGWRRMRLEVRPGITGLWQVTGRSDVLWEERMELDYTYARHWSMGRDLNILLRTVAAILTRRGAR
jgi:exopolysaccharide biosynthesis polyprenyl glycosylphosphotransferase